MLWHKLPEDLQEYLGLDEKPLREKLNYSHQAVVDHWRKLDPQTQQEREQFYVDTDTYLLELAAWILDFEGRQRFHQGVNTFREELKLETLLDFGCGIANEGLQAAADGLKVSLCDVSPISLDFALWRAHKHELEVEAVDSENLGYYDLVVLIDVLGHVEDPEDIIVLLAKHARYLFYTPDFQLPPPQNYWPMHLDKPPNFDRVMDGVWTKLHGGFYESKLFRPKVALDPDLKAFGGGEGGVKRQIEALTKLLPTLGIDLIQQSPDFAHLHATGKHPRNLVYTSHGYYPWNTTAPGEKIINAILKPSIATAKRVITVSEETVEIIREHLGVSATLIRNGVFLDQLDAVEPGIAIKRYGLKPPYFLWAKNTVEGVCDPAPSIELARLLPQYQFVFTKISGRDLPNNIIVVGSMSHPDMLELIKDCAVFLGTTKEQFSVQTLEAMGMSKPVLALPEGGNAKVIEHKVDGYVASNWQELPEGATYCLEHQEILGSNARIKVEDEYTWEQIIPQVVDLYWEAIEEYLDDLRRPLVSVIIPHYNLTQFLPQTLDSVLAQTIQNVEIIVIDDGSTQNMREIVRNYQDRIKFVKQQNQGVAAARNNGIAQSSGRYICCLDADDMIKPDFLEKLIAVLETDNRVSLAYCDFELFGDSKGIIKSQDYNFELLMRGNFIPCCNVFRREAWERTGGYKDINPSWEDYELWLNMGKMGFYGVRVPEPLFLYRKRRGQGRDYNSHGHEARLRAIVNSYHPDLYIPAVSVIIPTYNHTHYLPDVLRSLASQTFRDFDVTVVDDGNDDPEAITEICQEFNNQIPVKVIHHEENQGLAKARNTGVSSSRGKYVLTLDADDEIKSSFLERTIEALEERPDIAIAYTDIEIFGSITKTWEMPDYDFNALIQKNLMACAAPYRREVFDKLEGYMTDMPWGWEDYDFWIRAGRIGFCGIHIPEALFRYRRIGETMILRAQKHVSEMRAKLKEHSPDVFRGERPVGCCGRTRYLGRQGASMSRGFTGNGPGPQSGEYPLVKLRYKAQRPLMIKGAVTGTFYQTRGNQELWIDPRDAPQLISRNDFEYVVEQAPART